MRLREEVYYSNDGNETRQFIWEGRLGGLRGDWTSECGWCC